MQTHPASCLKGPISRGRPWWPQLSRQRMPENQLTAPVPASKQQPAEEVPSLADPEIRKELVERVRREIAEGTYETPEKWEAALDRLLERIE